MKIHYLSAIAALYLALPANAAIKPASLFTDNAVLQRDATVTVWGTADPSEPITVSVAGQTVSNTADTAGKWAVKLKPLAAGGPFSLTITGTPGDSVTLKNVLVGEVWVCGGQSNMYYPLNGFPNNPLTRAAIPLATDPMLHIANVPLTESDTPLTAVPVTWQEATPATVPTFTAVGYFFGRDLRKALGVPVGLIESCVGGTTAEAWTSRDALQAVPSLTHYLTELDDYTAAYPALLQKYNDAKAASDIAMAKWKADADAAKVGATLRHPDDPNGSRFHWSRQKLSISRPDSSTA